MGKIITVREARPQDDEHIGELLVDAFVTAYARKLPDVVVTKERKQTLRDVAGKRRHATVLVAELDGKIIGTVSLFRPGEPESEAWLANAADLRHLATAASMHGQGLAGTLLDRAEQIARAEWRVRHICLHVRREVAGIARLYMKRGYVRDTSGDLEKPNVSLEAYVLTLY